MNVHPPTEAGSRAETQAGEKPAEAQSLRAHSSAATKAGQKVCNTIDRGMTKVVACRLQCECLLSRRTISTDGATQVNIRNIQAFLMTDDGFLSVLNCFSTTESPYKYVYIHN